MYIKLIILGILTFINSGSICSKNEEKEEKKGLLEIHFPNSFEGVVTLHEWNNKEYVTLDSSQIIKGNYVYQYERIEEKTTTPVFIDVYIKANTSKKRLLVANPYFEAYSKDINLDNRHSIILIDTILSAKQERLIGHITGSIETDMNFHLTSEIFSQHKYKFTDSIYNHIIDFDFITKHPKSLLLLEKIYSDRHLYSKDSLNIAFNAFEPCLQNSKLGKRYQKYVKQTELYSKEGIKQYFVFYDENDKKYRYNDFIGNKELGLIVFWASWCAPCIREIPKLLDLHKKYGEKIAFVSLSIDLDKQKWIKAIKEHPITWLNLAGFPDSNTKVNDVFSPNYVPCFLIVNKSGHILVNSLNGEEEGQETREDIRAKNIEIYLNKYLTK